MPTCEHKNFRAKVDVNRLTKEDGGPVTGYNCDITIQCAECGLPFEFVGLPYGQMRTQPTVSIDNQELRAPLRPAARNPMN